MRSTLDSRVAEQNWKAFKMRKGSLVQMEQWRWNPWDVFKTQTNSKKQSAYRYVVLLQKYIPFMALWRKSCSFMESLAGWRNHSLVQDIFFLHTSPATLKIALATPLWKKKIEQKDVFLFSSKTPPSLRWCYFRATLNRKLVPAHCWPPVKTHQDVTLMQFRANSAKSTICH